MVNAILPWAMAHNHQLRVFSQVAVHDIIKEFHLADPVYASTLSMLQHNDEMTKVRNVAGPIFSKDIYGETEPRVLLAGANVGEKASDEEIDERVERGPDAAGFEGAPESAITRVEAFLMISRRDLRMERDILDKTLWDDAMAAGHDLTKPVSGTGIVHQNDVAAATSAVASSSVTADISKTMTSAMSLLQKKVDGGLSGAAEDVRERHRHLPPFSIPNALEAFAADLDRISRDDAGPNSVTSPEVCPERPPGLVVVASLVDKVPNLAGLARTCEVLGAEALAIADARVTKRHEFVSISVTAERWLPIHEVPLTGLRSYLLRLRAEGYMLIGLEQTRGAASLETFNFPQRAALVLGREREGIDADILGMLDGCVVITQHGMIRSLNVHVSASLAIHRYASQTSFVHRG